MRRNRRKEALFPKALPTRHRNAHNWEILSSLQSEEYLGGLWSGHLLYGKLSAPRLSELSQLQSKREALKASYISSGSIILSLWFFYQRNQRSSDGVEWSLEVAGRQRVLFTSSFHASFIWVIHQAFLILESGALKLLTLEYCHFGTEGLDSSWARVEMLWIGLENAKLSPLANFSLVDFNRASIQPCRPHRVLHVTAYQIQYQVVSRWTATVYKYASALIHRTAERSDSHY